MSHRVGASFGKRYIKHPEKVMSTVSRLRILHERNQVTATVTLSKIGGEAVEVDVRKKMGEHPDLKFAVQQLEELLITYARQDTARALGQTPPGTKPQRRATDRSDANRPTPASVPVRKQHARATRD